MSANTLEIEIKSYEADSTPEELEMLKGRVTLLNDSTILFNESPIQSDFSINLFFDCIEEIAEKNNDVRYLLIDLNEANRPDAKARKRINERFAAINNKFKHVAYCTGKNIIINTAIKFVMFGIGLKSYSVDKEMSDALKAIENAN